MKNKNNALKALTFSLLLGGSCLASAGLQTQHYNLPPNHVVTIKGSVLMDKKVRCVVRAEEKAPHKLEFVSLHNSNIINSTIIVQGKTTSLSLKPDDSFFLEMEKNSELGITNTGNDLVNLECE